MEVSLLKKVLLILLVSTMILSIVSCGKTDSQDKNESSTKEGDIKKPEKITLFSTTTIDEEQGHKQLQDEFKKFTGIELELIKPDHNQYFEVMASRFAAGNVPDIIEIGEQQYVKYASKGALVDVTNMISNSEILNKIEPDYIDAAKIDGKLYGVPLQTGGGCLTYMRQDWLDNLGLEVPKTYDEFYKVLEAFRDNDPDKNGKDDTIPFTAVLSAEDKIQLFYLRDFLWDSSPDFTLVDGKWIDGFTQDNFKEALERLKKAYADKLIDSEIFTNETSTCRDKFCASKVGAFPYWNNYWISRLEDTTRQQSDENAELVPAPAIKESYSLNRPPVVTSITTKAENPEGIFKYFMEYIHDGDQGQNLFSFGVEGTHWKKGNDGKVEMLPQLNNPEQLIDKIWFSADNTILPYKNGPLVPLDPRIEKTLEAFKQNYKQVYIFPLSETYVENMSNIDKLRVELASKIISDQMSIDEAMEKYKSTAKKLKIDKILKDFNSSN
ncbi:MAG: extracellular solute-binding protein [Clostridiales bacterium]